VMFKYRLAVEDALPAKLSGQRPSLATYDR
jgi:hypothetical protein